MTVSDEQRREGAVLRKWMVQQIAELESSLRADLFLLNRYGLRPADDVEDQRVHVLMRRRQLKLWDEFFANPSEHLHGALLALSKELLGRFGG